MLRDNPLPVMFSAPDATEPFAGALGLMMDEGGFPAIVRTRADEFEAADYEVALGQYAQQEKIVVVFELHQLPEGDERDAVVSVGSAAELAGHEDIAQHLIDQLSEIGLDNVELTDETAAATTVPSMSVAFHSELFTASGVAGSDADNIAAVLKRVALFAVAQEANKGTNG